MKPHLLLVGLTYMYVTVAAQPTANFFAPSTACLNQVIRPTNTSSFVTQYFWDFNQGDLLLTPSSVNMGNMGGNIPYGVETAFDGINWYGFIVSKGDNSLIRLDFGNDLDQIPTTQVFNGILGSIGPTDIEIVFSDNEWFGFVYGVNQVVTRLDFGNDLSNTPAVKSIIAEAGGSDGGIDILSDGMNWYIIYTSGSQVGVAKLLDIKSAPGLSERNSYVINNGLILGDIKLVLSQGKWFAYTTSYYGANQLMRLNFDTEILSPPVISNISGTLLNSVSPYGIDISFDNGIYVAFISTREGDLLRFELGADLNQVPSNISNLGTLGILSNTLKIKLQKWGTRWYAFSVNWANNSVYKILFPDAATPATPTTSKVENPDLFFTGSGSYYITLEGRNGPEVSYAHESILIENKQAPTIDLSFQGLCNQSVTSFNSLSPQSLLSTNWSFGDTKTSTDPNPTNQYASAGDYLVSLQVTADNGCNNYVEKPIKIYDPPDAQFTLPLGLICTNNEFAFTNNTLDNFDGNLSYEWLVNDVLESTARDFNYAFTAGGDQQVKLKTSIPGCSDELTQTLLNVQIGPVVNFSYTGKCEEEAILFANESSGSISGYEWDFGNGHTSTLENPTEYYPSYGNFNVSLHTTGINGCVSTLTKPVTIYSVPETNFSIDLPPFSCSGSPSQFNDLTPPMPDSNITSWAWSFGDLSNGSSSQKNPLYTYSLAGDYSVTLSTATNYGCSNSIQKTVTIHPSPTADFSFGPACVNQETQFTDLSTGDIKSWLWSIQSNTYTSTNPKHTFKSASSYPALLTVTGNSGCVSQATKNVNVPVAVLPDFTSSSTCEDKPAVFDEVTKGGADPATSWSWNFANQGSGIGSPAEHVFSSTGNYSVTMSTTRQSGCTYSVTKTIPIVESPKAQFNLFLESGAAPFTTNLTNQSTKATKYLWKPGDPKQSNSTAFAPTFTYTDLGDYTIELEATNELGCTDYMEQLIHVVIPQINAAVADFRLEAIPGSNDYSPVVTIENKSNVALIDPLVYLDISGNATVSQSIQAIIKPDELLTYRFSTNIAPQSLEFACAEVKVTADVYAFDNRQCVNLVDEYVSIGPYPNPASDELMLEWINNFDEPMDLVIYNAAGQTVISRKYEPSLKGLNQVKLDVSALSSGIYFVSYSIDGQAQNFRFSIVR
jgi:PKD repeat protein